VLSVLESSRYTTTINLTYLLPPSLPPGPTAGAAGTDFERLPDVQVRVYHDAHLAEAQDCRLREATGVAIPRSALPKRELVRRWQRNMMLNKWLEYCVERGHRFHLPG